MLRLLLPALMPSWRFFDRVGPSARVEFTRVVSGHADGAAWREVSPRPARLSPAAMLWRLVWNPGWNESLYLVSSAERLLEDPSPERAARLTARVAGVLGDDAASGEPGDLRIRVLLVSRGDDGMIRREVAYVSGPAFPGEAS